MTIHTPFDELMDEVHNRINEADQALAKLDISIKAQTHLKVLEFTQPQFNAFVAALTEAIAEELRPLIPIDVLSNAQLKRKLRLHILNTFVNIDQKSEK